MAVLSWGKCGIEKTISKNGAPSEEGWKEIATPKEDSTQVTASAGKESIATEEGGGIVDVRHGKNTYEFTFDLFVAKGSERPFVDNDGIIDGEFAFRITPEDEECEGIQIDRAKVRCEEKYTTAEGIVLHYVAKCLKPASGNTVKPYTKVGG